MYFLYVTLLKAISAKNQRQNIKTYILHEENKAYFKAQVKQYFCLR